MPSAPLCGVRIWLSGSVPKGSTEQERQRIEDFTRQLTDEAFLRNATQASLGLPGEAQMKKQLEKNTNRLVPAFTTEAEEAAW